MNEEDAVKIFDLAVRGKKLPAKMEELIPLSFIGAAAVKFYKTKVGLMEQLGMTEDQRKATLADGQDAGRMLLTIEARIGELLGPPKSPKRRSDGKLAGRESLPENVDFHDAHRSRTIANNPEAVAEVIAEAEENEDIPTKTAVLNKVKLKKETARRKTAEKQVKDQTEIALDVIDYLNALERCIAILPTEPPRDWTEATLTRAKGFAKVIIKRLEVLG